LNRLARAAAIVVMAVVAGCGSGGAARRRTASRLLDGCKYDSARVLVKALARRSPNDTGVLGLQVRLYSAERRLREATDALRRHDSLVGTHDSAVLAQVLKAALKDGDEACAVGAIKACGELAVAPLYPSVESALDDRSPWVRRAAVYAIPRYNRDSAAYTIVGAMLDDDPYVRAEMLQSMVRLGDKSMLDVTRALGYLETNDYVIWYYMAMCAVLGHGGMKERVRGELDAKYDVLRTEAAATLVRIGEKQRIGQVAAGLHSSEAPARISAARALGDLHAAEYLDSLAGCAGDTVEKVREAVAYGLGEMGEPRGADAVRGLLGDKEESVRARALVALCRLQQPDMGELAAKALADSSPAVRATAVAVLLAEQTRRP
jgi:HEAT repeat protein